MQDLVIRTGTDNSVDYVFGNDFRSYFTPTAFENFHVRRA